MNKLFVKTGSEAERFIANYFQDVNGFATILYQGITGNQPFDIVGITKDKTYALDSKLCKRDYFTFSRVEVNQKNAMSYLANIGNDNLVVGFVIVYKDNMYYLDYKKYEELDKAGVKSVKATELERFVIS